MKRRSFIKKAALTGASTMVAPYILPSGRLFAATGSRVVNHVVYVLFAGGIRNQESVGQQFVATQDGQSATGNVMYNMLAGAAPTVGANLYDPFNPVLSQPLTTQGTLFKEVMYNQGPPGHYNGHTVAMTGKYTATGLNLNINPEAPTIFEYYRKHSEPSKSALNAWWLSEGLGPYPSLNYSRDPNYGPAYGANYMRPASIFSDVGFSQIMNAVNYQTDDVARLLKVKGILDNNFDKNASDLPGIQNTPEERELIKSFMLQKMADAANGTLEVATPGNNYNLLTNDLLNVSTAWHVLDTFAPELMVINTSNLDVCHDDFGRYLYFLHRADYGIGWLWNKIQSHPILANDTVMICVPEHGRNLVPNNITDSFGLRAFDHTAEDVNLTGYTMPYENSRRIFSLVVGPSDKIVQNQSFGSIGNPVGESIDMIPTIAHLLGFKDDIPAGYLPGRVLTEALI